MKKILYPFLILVSAVLVLWWLWDQVIWGNK